MADGGARAAALETVRSVLADSDLEWEEIGDGLFSVTLPGERKLQTPCRLDVGEHSFAVHAFVARHPDENHERVYRWLLERNLRLFGVSFAVDHMGDIYLDGRLPLSSVTPDEVDRLLGAVLSYADESFNTILELGFASSIRKEWEWRRLRGEPTHNLEAFRGWLEADEEPSAGEQDRAEGE
jgi:Putative bacterial sensory transduction regulator